MSERCGLEGCWDQNEVDICWRRYVTNKATALRYGPSLSTDVVPQQMTCVGTGALAAGETVCLQSTRNPTCLESPPLRPAENGFVWAYENDCKISGWIPAADVAPQAGTPCCGPAAQDFPCGVPAEPRCEQAEECHPEPSGTASSRSGCARVNARELTLRYAPQSTAFRYLLDGDIVRRRCGHSSGYHCVDVLESNTAQGARGWVTAGGGFLVDVTCPT